MIEPKNLLPVVDMLLHPDNTVNGQVITVDGGWSL
jgi:NAD(P)-dependent dehydrogenase (short-subunit alcohol dehydrogenase family)